MREQQDTRPIQALIVAAAVRHQIPPAVPLAFAYLESRFDPAAEGDLAWASRNGGALYRAHVLNSSRLNPNPARNDPSAWHSYGLFQLLAPYWVPADQHPRVLLDPQLNTELGVRYIASLLRKHGGDVAAARLAYTGCGADGSKCSQAKQAELRTKLQDALRRFQRPNV